MNKEGIIIGKRYWVRFNGKPVIGLVLAKDDKYDGVIVKFKWDYGFKRTEIFQVINIITEYKKTRELT
jgi:hypothetical protein